MSWEKVKLSEVAKLVTGKTPPTTNQEYFNGDILWINPSDFNGKIFESSKRTLTDKAVYHKKCNLLPKGSLLLSCIGDIGKVGILSSEGTSNQQITALILNGKVLPDYLYYYLVLSKPKLENLANKAVVAILNNERLKEFEIPLPPLHIQQHIADVLDKADALRQKDQLLLQKYNELAKSIFYDMFGDPVKNEKGWEFMRIDKATSFIDYRGKTPQRSTEVEVPLITAKNVKFGYYDFSEEDFVTEEVYEKMMTRGFPKPNDVLFTTEGATLGNVCRIPNIQKFAVGQRLICLTGITVTQEYLHYMMCSEFFQDQVYKKATGSAAKGIRSAELKKLVIPVPDYALQQKFSERLYVLEKQKDNSNLVVNRSKNLFTGLLNKFFS